MFGNAMDLSKIINTFYLNNECFLFDVVIYLFI